MPPLSNVPLVPTKQFSPVTSDIMDLPVMPPANHATDTVLVVPSASLRKSLRRRTLHSLHSVEAVSSGHTMSGISLNFGFIFWSFFVNILWRGQSNILFHKKNGLQYIS